MATDAELVDMLDDVWASIADLGSTLHADEWVLPTDLPGWSVQDNLVHITAVEAALLGRPLPEAEIPDDLPHVKNGFGRKNEQWIESRRSWTGADALSEFREVTKARAAALRALDHDAFGADAWTPLGPGTVRSMLAFRLFDAWVHEQDMRRAVGRPGNAASAAADHVLGMTAAGMDYVVGKQAAAPEGSTVVLSLQGPLACDLAITVVDGRAGLVESTVAVPTVVITTDALTFVRLANGRVDPGSAITSGAVVFEGDVALGRRVVEHMNFLF